MAPTNPESEALGKIALARAYVKQNAPYFSPTLYGFIPHAYPGLTELAGGPLAVTEHLVLLYEPSWVQEVDTWILATGLGHEVLHDQLRHIRRMKLYQDKKRANRAGDLFINGTMAAQQRDIRVVEGGKPNIQKAPLWKFPDWALMPSQFGFEDGLTLGEYYRLLEEHDKKEKGSSGDNQKGPDGKTDDAKIMSGCCGGIAGNPLLQELEEALDNIKGRSNSECIQKSKETASAMRQHMEGPGRGSIPGAWSEIIQASNEVFEVPWHTKLSRHTRSLIGNIRTGGMDYSLRRPSRRSYLRGMPLPGLIAYEPVIWIVMDSSASMGKKQLADGLRVCTDILQQTGVTRIWYLEADVKVQKTPVQVSIQDLRNMKIHGRGGTDFRPVLALAEAARPKPDIVIYLTDGDGTTPATQPPGINVIWCIVPSSYRRKPAEWGETIFLDAATA